MGPRQGLLGESSQTPLPPSKDRHRCEIISKPILTLLQGGLVLALGGHRALSQTASQADIIMHSRIFYYARIRGVTIPYTPYRDWLRAQFAAAPESTRIWEWELLQALCDHRDRIAGGGTSLDDEARARAAAEKDSWLRQLLLDEGSLAASNGHHHDDEEADSSKPAWMAAAPRAELYVDRPENTDDDQDAVEGQVPYPKKFADIIKAVQTGEPIEGVVDIPDIVARNPVSIILSPADMATHTLKIKPAGTVQYNRKKWTYTDFG